MLGNSLNVDESLCDVVLRQSSPARLGEILVGNSSLCNARSSFLHDIRYHERVKTTYIGRYSELERLGIRLLDSEPQSR